MSAYDVLTAGLSGAGLVLLGLVTVQGSSDYHLNAEEMQANLQDAASEALIDAGQTWATVTMNGQRALIVGAPPSIEAAELAKQLVYTSSGPGGMLRGGVWAVETDFDEIRDLPTMSPYVWRAIKSPAGTFILVGGVPDDQTKKSLADHAQSFSAEPLDDRTELTLGLPEGDWIGTAMFGLDQLNLLDSGEARLTDHELRLSGIAMDDAARIQATASVANIDSPWIGIAKVDGPSHWKAEHVDGTLVLSGSCETAEDRAEVASIAESYFDGPVIDEMTVEATEYENWIQGVRLGLPHFSKFESGQMEFEPDGEGFSFEGEATRSTLQYLREDMSQLEGDYAVDIAAETVTIALEEIADVDLGDDPLLACQTSFDLILEANAVVFESSSANISRASGITLDKIMAVSESCAESLNFEIAGHTDSTGTRDGNIALSRARAQAVATYMSEAGFDRTRLMVNGIGPDQPKVSNATAEGRAANRRIEFNVQERSE
ncbi:MAG: OmpA family protein [Pseudomonadota bacterium]